VLPVASKESRRDPLAPNGGDPLTATWPAWVIRGFLLAVCLEASLSRAQTGGSTLDQHQQAGNNSTAGHCLQPAPLFSTEDYKGPFRKLVVYFSRKPEIKTVPPIHDVPSSVFCALEPTEKFRLFVQNTLKPVTFAGAAYDAGISQAQDDDPTFGQGSAGYGKRYGAALADQASDGFFHTFLYPVVFRQDPRYYRQLEGTGPRAAGACASHGFVTRGDSGRCSIIRNGWVGPRRWP
jgi:hypothetical protein